jgi:hypothetical protein
VLGVTAMAAVASYEHAYDLVRARGEDGWDCGGDRLIAHSAAARRRTPAIISGSGVAA